MMQDFWICCPWHLIQITSKFLWHKHLFDKKKNELLNLVFFISRFHTFNACRTSDGGPTSNSVPAQGTTEEGEVYAKSQDQRTPQGWLVHLINLWVKLLLLEQLIISHSSDCYYHFKAICSHCYRAYLGKKVSAVSHSFAPVYVNTVASHTQIGILLRL